MDFNEYQNFCAETAKYPGRGETMGLAYTVIGLSGEAGEVAEKFKKILRDKNGVMSPEDRLAFAKELGDALWYITENATQIDMTLEEIAQMNIDKLRSRKARGKLSGSGDDR